MGHLRHILLNVLGGLLVIGTLLLVPGVARAGDKEPLVVVLSSSQSEPYQQVVDGFWQQLHHQYQETKGYTYFLGPDLRKNRELMAEIDSREPDLLFTLGSMATKEVQAAYPNKPLVATMVLDEQLLSQGKQTTGVTLRFPAKVHLDGLRRILPDVRRIYLLYNPAENAAMFKEFEKEAKPMGLEIHGLAVESVAQLPAALKSVGRQADMLLGLADQTVYSSKTAKAVLLSTFRDRIPFAGLSRSWVKAGALYALERDYADLGRQCAEMVCQILDGTKVADVVPVSPERVLYVINMKTAKHLRVIINPSLVKEAAEVFN